MLINSFFQKLMTVICNEKRIIEEIINPQKNLLAGTDFHELIGKNISEFDKLSLEDDNESLKVIIENVKHTEKFKKNFFKYTIKANKEKNIDAVCMSEQHDNGYIYIYIICTNQSNIKDETELFKHYILDDAYSISSIGLSICYINAKRKKHQLIFNDTLKELYCCDDAGLSKELDEDEETQTDLLALKEGSCTFDKRLFNDDGSIHKWLIVTKKIMRCNNDGHYVISTTTDATKLHEKYYCNTELNQHTSLNNSTSGNVAANDSKGMTSIKSNETLLEIKNEKLNIALENSGLIIWEYNCDTQQFIADKGHTKVTEFYNNSLDYYKDYVSKETYDSYIKVHDILTNRKDETFIVDVCLSNPREDKLMYLTFSGKPYKHNENGEVISYIGYRKDVTSGVKLLKNLQESITKNKLILDNIGTGLAYIDLNYNIIWKNSSFNELHEINIPDEKLLGNKCYRTIHNRETPCIDCIVRKVLKSGKIKILSSYKNSHDVFNITGLPVKDKEKQIIGVVLRIEKITNEYKAKKESESLSRMLQKIIDNLPLGLYIKNIDDDFKYIIVNKTVCKLSKLTPEECIGKTDYEILDKKDADAFRKDDEDIVRLYAETKLPVIKFKRLLLGHSEKILKTLNIVYKHEDKNILISIAHNETEREKIIKELSVAKAHAEESDRLKSAFLANMSHEIRTPLNAIVGFSEVIATNDNKEENKEYIKIIQFNNQILLRLINDILDLSKLDAGVIKLKNKEFDLAELDNNYKAFYDNNKLNNDVEFITELPYSKCIVNLDEQRFMQVICNFITNAIKYTDNGYIKFGYRYENNGIKVYVKDTGTGIPKGVQNKLFTRFGKLNENVQGNGLGLTICKAIMEMQNGKIGFESEEKKGSTFWAWFPTNADVELKNDEFNICNISKSVDNIPSIDNIKPQKIKKNIKILVAEDNDSNFLLLNTLLDDYDLTRVVNGKEAVEKVKQSSFDLIIMDMKMPIMGGLEATKLIREFNKGIKIVALTASIFSSDMKAEREAGCNEIITKPITMKGRECLFDIINSL